MRRDSLHLFGLDGLVNVGRVDEGIYRGADPLPKGFKTLSDLGIRTILNLSHDDDAEFIRPYGIQELHLPLNFIGEVDRWRVKNAVSVLSDASLYPIYVHCAQGRDRTGIVVACYRIESGRSNKDAIDEMWSFGFHFVWSHFLEFVQNFQRS